MRMVSSTVCCRLQDCLEMAGIGGELRGLPQGTDLIQGPRVQRQVSMTPSSRMILHAAIERFWLVSRPETLAGVPAAAERGGQWGKQRQDSCLCRLLVER